MATTTPHRSPEPGHHHLPKLRYVSWLLFGVGLLLVLLGELTGLSATVALVGGLLIVAGVVKVVTVRIWDGFFREALVESEHRSERDHE
jgi:hypothetical protein